MQHDRVVRVMPNTPAQIGQGMSVWTATENVPMQDKQYVKTLLSTLGSEWFVEDEDFIDSLVPPGEHSGIGFQDTAYPISGRATAELAQDR